MFSRQANWKGSSIPLEVEVLIDLPPGDAPVVPSVQSIWVGADWNEKETWDLVGIRFEGHENMHRVLNCYRYGRVHNLYIHAFYDIDRQYRYIDLGL